MSRSPAKRTGRFVDIRGSHGQGSPSLDQVYTEATAPGLTSQPAFAQFGEGINCPAINRDLEGSIGLRLFLSEFITPGVFRVGSTLRTIVRAIVVSGQMATTRFLGIRTIASAHPMFCFCWAILSTQSTVRSVELRGRDGQSRILREAIWNLSISSTATLRG